jgi:hypothetical protein
MHNVYLNVLRHLLLISNKNLNPKIRDLSWKLIEAFVHRTVIVRQEDDNREDSK